MVFGKANTTVDVALSIDGTASKCTGEAVSYEILICLICALNLLQVTVGGTAVAFPNLANKTDCLGNVLRGTGALTTDLEVKYDPTADTITVEVDSEGVNAVLKVCS